MLNDVSLPSSQNPIFVDWTYPRAGGLRISAWTDRKANPYLGIFTLNRMGKPNGLPCWYERQSFLSSVVVGFDEENYPVKIFLDAGITSQGLYVSLQLPWEPRAAAVYHERLFSSWGSESPALGYIGSFSDANDGACYTLSTKI